MNQYYLQNESSKELQAFPHIAEIGLKKSSVIQLNSLSTTETKNIRIYYIIDGKFEWVIDGHHYVLYPGDLALILPGQNFGGKKDFLDIGTLSWLHLQSDKVDRGEGTIFGRWSNLSDSERLTIGKILSLNKTTVIFKVKEAWKILQEMEQEIASQEIGYVTRVNQLLDALFILIARQCTRQNTSRRDFPQTFMKLEQTLRQNLEHQWTVEEMAALVGLGTTAFNEKVKSYTGFSPLNYLINIRVSEAIKLLKRQDISVTDIALSIGFYSSQHFSTTFKKLTGYTPGEFRKIDKPKT